MQNEKLFHPVRLLAPVRLLETLDLEYYLFMKTLLVLISDVRVNIPHKNASLYLGDKF